MNAHQPVSEAGREALKVARNGRPVFPCKKRNKAPYTPHGLDDASLDPLQIEAWWRQWPDAMIGVPTGSRINAWALDVDLDPEKGTDGTAALAALEAEHGPLPATVESRTPRGGRHFLFRWDPKRPVTNSPGQLPKGIDVRGEGGYIIAPPSKREDGASYRWENPPGLFDPVEAPEWLYRLLVRPERKASPDPLDFNTAGPQRVRDQLRRMAASVREEAYARAALSGITGEITRTGEGRRNHTLNACAYRLGRMVARGWIAREEAERHLLGAAHACGLVEDDGEMAAVKTINSGLTAGELELHEDLKEREQGGQAAPEEDTGGEAGRSIAATPFLWIDPVSIQPRRFLYGKHLIRQFVSTTVAPGGVGKSSLGMVEALAMASGKPLLGLQPPSRLRVWLWNGEDPLEELQRRVMAVALHYGLKREDFEGYLFLDSGRRMPIVIAEQTRDGAKVAAPVVEAVKATIIENRIDVAVIDPFVSSHRVTENDNNAIERVAKTWAGIADVTACAADLVHHTKKTGGVEATVEDGRGAVALLAAARSARVLNAMTEDEAGKAGVEDRRHFFRVDNGKSNLAPAEGTTWFKMNSVELGNGDNVGVVGTWKWPDPFDDITIADLRAAQNTVAAGGPWRENNQAMDWVGRPIAQALKLDPENKAHKKKIASLLKVWIENGAFVRVPGRDAKRMEKTFVEVGQWATD